MTRIAEAKHSRTRIPLQHQRVLDERFSQGQNHTHARIVILSQRHSRSHDTTQIEYRPKNGDELSLVVLRRVSEHQRALGGP